MAIEELDASQIVTVFMTTTVDDAKLNNVETEPLPAHDSQGTWDGAKERLKDNARYWDEYKKILHLSFLQDDVFTHILHVDSGRCRLGNSRRSILNAQDDSVVVAYIHSTLGSLFGDEHNSQPLFQKLLVGWHMTSEIWPVIVNRLLRYNYPVYRGMVASPTNHYQSSKYIGNIEAIYQQGEGYRRDLPTLNSMLRSWGCYRGETLPANMELALTEDYSGTLGIVEQYLVDMREALWRYYGITPNTKKAVPLPGMPVPAEGDVRCLIHK